MYVGRLAMNEKIERRPNLSILALVSFILSFLIARTFTSLSPKTVMLVSGLHIHHFWYGLIMLAVGGWLGISYHNESLDRVAAVLFGAGGGLLGDEVGLLLTFGDYWSGITYTFLIVFTAFASTLILLFKYFKTIRSEFTGFLRSNASFYVSVFLAAVSISFILGTDDIIIAVVSSITTIVALIIICVYLVQHFRKRH